MQDPPIDSTPTVFHWTQLRGNIYRVSLNLLMIQGQYMTMLTCKVKGQSKFVVSTPKIVVFDEEYAYDWLTRKVFQALDITSKDQFLAIFLPFLERYLSEKQIELELKDTRDGE